MWKRDEKEEFLGDGIFSQKLGLAKSDPTMQGALSKYDQNEPRLNIVLFSKAFVHGLIGLQTHFFVDCDKFSGPKFKFHT